MCLEVSAICGNLRKPHLLNECFQWTPTGIKVKRYTLNESLWNDMKEAGLKFYDLHRKHFMIMKKQLFSQTDAWTIDTYKKRKLDDDDNQDEIEEIKD